jgi:phosphatidylglycerophosphate synthase
MTDARAPRTGKPREAQGWSNAHVFHPAAKRLAGWLARTPATPNMVSVFGAAMVVTAGVLYAWVGSPAAILAGFAIHLAWHVVDGADGDLARMTGRASPIGEVVDGLCDYGGHIALYLLLAGALFPTLGWAAWALAVAAGLSRVVQSVYAETQRRTYLWWAYGVPWLRTSGPTGRAGVFARVYLSISHWLSAGAEAVERFAADGDPRLAPLARREGRRTLPLQVALGANARTMLLGLGMIAGSAAWFFLIEASVLNLLLAISIVQQRAASARIARALGGTAGEAAGSIGRETEGGR